jgi:hypothetical protein
MVRSEVFVVLLVTSLLCIPNSESVMPFMEDTSIGVGSSLCGRVGRPTVIASSLPECESASDGCIVALPGFYGFIDFKVWEFVDSIVGPIRDNRQYRSLQSRSQMSMKPEITIQPMPVIGSNDESQKSTHMGIGLNLTFH